MGAPNENTNAEKWTLEKAKELFDNCLKTAKDKELDCNDFIGEVAQANDTTLYQLDYLREKYTELETIYKQIKYNCEANCFANAKKGKIVPSLGIINLKSNHGWTDRVESTNTNNNINTDVTPISFVNTNNDKDK